MENALQKNRPSDAPAREIGVITAEINDLRRQAYNMLLIYAVEIGRRLDEAKRALPHGKWGEYLRTEVDFSQRQANNLMRLYEEYGSPQLTLFGASLKSQTYANLPISKALLLIAVPEEEREDFTKEVNAEDLSVRELKAAIEERDKALKTADMQKKLKEEFAAKWKAADEKRQEAQLQADKAKALQGQLDQMAEQVRREQAAAADLRNKLEQALKNPAVPKATIDKLHKEAEAAAKKAAEANAQKELEEAKKKAEKATAEAIKARNDAAAAKASLEEARKALKTASPEVAAFKALFDDIQSTAAKLHGMIELVRGTDPETADKLAKALKAFGASL